MDELKKDIGLMFIFTGVSYVKGVYRGEYLGGAGHTLITRVYLIAHLGSSRVSIYITPFFS